MGGEVAIVVREDTSAAVRPDTTGIVVPQLVIDAGPVRDGGIALRCCER